MGKFLDQVKQRGASIEAIAHRVSLRQTSSRAKSLIVESGEDVYFYTAMLTRIGLTDRFEIFKGDGKPGVIGVLEQLQRLGKHARSYGIVDRDFDLSDPELSFDDHCLTLDVYSFENYYGDQSVMRQTAIALFDVEPGSAEQDRWLRVVDSLLDYVETSLRREHCLALHHRSKSQTCLLSNFDPRTGLVLDFEGAITSVLDTFE